MKYLRIANPGVADPTALTLLGAGTSRYSNVTGTIGMFGSGSKLAAALLLRNGLAPVVMTGNLVLTYKTKDVEVGGQVFDQVQIKYSGTDAEGRSRSSTEDLGYTLQWGEQDWDDLMMAPREYLANAIDGCLSQGLDDKAVEIEIVDKVGRAKAGWTQVFIPADPKIIQFHAELNIRFLHFTRQRLAMLKLLPKIVPNEQRARIYKNGVLVAILDQPSVFDYNLSSELKLDESRNAQEWAVKAAVGRVLAHADAGALATVIKGVSAESGQPQARLLESEISSEYLSDYYGTSSGKRVVDKSQWQRAFRMVAGDQGVASSGMIGIDSHLKQKGLEPIKMPENWIKVLDQFEVPVESKVLSEDERAGMIEGPATADMIEAVAQVWQLLEERNLTNGRQRPEVVSFKSIMTGGSQKLGEYRSGKVWLHEDIGTGLSPMLRTTALEEVVHHVTGAGDMSRDIQDFLFRLVTEIVWGGKP